MKMNKMMNIIDRIPYYYDYFTSLKEKGIVNVTAKQIADSFAFKNTSMVNQHLSHYIDNPGRKNYGYHVVFIQKELSKLMMLDNPVSILLIGEQYPLIDIESLKKRNFTIVWNFTTKEIFENNNTLQGLITESHKDAVVILTMKISDNIFQEIEKFASCIINLSGTQYIENKIPIYNFDIVEAALCTWHQNVKKHYITDDE